MKGKWVLVEYQEKLTNGNNGSTAPQIVSGNAGFLWAGRPSLSKGRHSRSFPQWTVVRLGDWLILIFCSLSDWPLLAGNAGDCDFSTEMKIV